MTMKKILDCLLSNQVRTTHLRIKHTKHLALVVQGYVIVFNLGQILFHLASDSLQTLLLIRRTIGKWQWIHELAHDQNLLAWKALMPSIVYPFWKQANLCLKYQDIFGSDCLKFPVFSTI